MAKSHRGLETLAARSTNADSTSITSSSGLGRGGPTDQGAQGGHRGQGDQGGHVGQGGHGFKGFGDVFSFTLSGSSVTAAEVTLPSGTKVALPLTTGVNYSVSGTDVLATKTDTFGTHLLRYSDTDADGLFEVIASSHVLTSAPQVNMLGLSTRETLKASIAADGVTAVSQTRWDGTEKVLLSSTVTPANTTWSVSNGLLVETHTNPNNGQAHWEVFRDGNADGVYTQVAFGNGDLIDLVGVVSQTDAIATLL